MRRLCMLWLALLCVLAAQVQAQAQASDAATRAAAKRANRAAVVAFARARYQQAIARSTEADRLVPSADNSYNIARAYEALHDDTSALAWYRDYLRRAPGAHDGARVRRKIAVYEARLAARGLQEVTVTSSPPGAFVWIDGAFAGIAPWIGALRAGEHRARLSLDQQAAHAAEERTFTVQLEHAQTLALVLHEPAAPAPAAQLAEVAGPRPVLSVRASASPSPATPAHVTQGLARQPSPPEPPSTAAARTSLPAPDVTRAAAAHPAPPAPQPSAATQELASASSASAEPPAAARAPAAASSTSPPTSRPSQLEASATASSSPAAEASAEPLSVAQRDDRSGSRAHGSLRALGIASMAGGALGLGGALVFEVLRRNAESDARAQSVQIEYAQQLQTVQDRQLLARVFAVAGGAALIGGVVLFAISRGSSSKDDSAEAPRADVGLDCAAAGCRVAMRGRF